MFTNWSRIDPHVWSISWRCLVSGCTPRNCLRRMSRRPSEGIRPWNEDTCSNDHRARGTWNSLRAVSTGLQKKQGVDILSLSMIDSDLYTCSANGQVQRWSANFDCTASWSAHNGIILSSVITRSVKSDSWRLVTGANDNCIKVCLSFRTDSCGC